jgi:DivIVA domain-containing protein
MTPDELRSAELRERFRGHDPEQVEAALTRWADIIARGGRLSPAELLGQRFTPKFCGYDPAVVQALVERLIAGNT